MHDQLNEILADPIVRQLMRSDRVDPAELRALMAHLRRRPGVQAPPGGPAGGPIQAGSIRLPAAPAMA